MIRDDRIEAIEKRILKYCLNSPYQVSLVRDFLNCLTSRRSLASLIYHSLLDMAHPIPKRIETRPKKQIGLLFDARYGWGHGLLWCPIAMELNERGLPIAFLTEDGHFSCPPIKCGFSDDYIAVKTYSIREINMNRKPHYVELYKKLPPDCNKWPFIEKIIIRIINFQMESMISAWDQFLDRSKISAFITTNPIGSTIGSLLVSCRNHGIKTICLQKGLPGGSLWRIPSTDYFIVWSEIGSNLLQKEGWPSSRVLLGDYPAKSTSSELARIRAARRAVLGIHEDELCVLFIGQVSRDWGLHQCIGYEESCKLAAMSFKQMDMQNARIVLRPHYQDLNGETSGIFNGIEFFNYTISQGSKGGVLIHEDLAASDIVISYNSTGLEEALFIGKPTIQVAAEGFDLPVDFRPIGTILARSESELVQAIQQARNSKPSVRQYPKAVDLIEGVIRGNSASPQIESEKALLSKN